MTLTCELTRKGSIYSSNCLMLQDMPVYHHKSRGGQLPTLFLIYTECDSQISHIIKLCPPRGGARFLELGGSTDRVAAGHERGGVWCPSPHWGGFCFQNGAFWASFEGQRSHTA